ncbi:YybH family protein [Rhodanobacter ginsengisoli]|uniref:YybH family protein n=1 Tax=Rhodanobacter ginsengisoli TaxID=418646 RepID=A0ABW0QNJ4_9GAMM
MSRIMGLVLLLAWSGAMAAPPAAKPRRNGAACAVWQRELAFARSVQRHDAAAFASHVADDAVFDANTATPTHGRDAIREHWAAIIAGKNVQLSWYPQQVVTTADGTLAYSSGAYLLVTQPSADKPASERIGRFATVWRRGRDRVWRVAFDGGDEARPATAAQVAAFRAGRRDACPRDTPAGSDPGA